MDRIAAAIRIALRSPHKRFKTGAVLVRGDEIIATGWSHPTAMQLRLYSMHAEQHMLRRVDLRAVEGATVYIATVSGKNGNLTNGRPCLDCIRVLAQAGVATVCYTLPSGTEELDTATCLSQEFKDYHQRWQLR